MYQCFYNTIKHTGSPRSYQEYFKSTPSAVKCIEYTGKLEVGSAYVYENGTDTETMIESFALTCDNLQVLWLSELGEEIVSDAASTIQHMIVSVPPGQSRLLVLRPLAADGYNFHIPNLSFNMSSTIAPTQFEKIVKASGEVWRIIAPEFLLILTAYPAHGVISWRKDLPDNATVR